MNMAAILFFFIFILLQLFARNRGGDEDDQRGTMIMRNNKPTTLSNGHSIGNPRPLRNKGDKGTEHTNLNQMEKRHLQSLLECCS